MNSAHVHDQLRERNYKDSESFKDYSIVVSGLAKLVALEELAFIKYIVRGITDVGRNIIISYGASSIDELKVRIETYERMKSAMNEATPSTLRVFTRTNSATVKREGESSSADAAQKRQPKKSFLCYNCKTIGYLSEQNAMRSDISQISVRRLRKQVRCVCLTKACRT